jgi:hypothetical protein
MDDPQGFDAILEALAIFRRYVNPSYPFHCEHDVLYVLVSPRGVAEEDRQRLAGLGFVPSGSACEDHGDEPEWEYCEDCEHFLSFRFGSA